LPNPNAAREDYIDGLKLTDAEFQVIKSLDERSRCFLVKQGHASTVCQLNLRGMDDALAVISASTDNIEIMHRIVDDEAQRLEIDKADLLPEQWLPRFQQERKGSRTRKEGSAPSSSTREDRSNGPRATRPTYSSLER
jgi:type IV secretion system protein VirB4